MSCERCEELEKRLREKAKRSVRLENALELLAHRDVLVRCVVQARDPAYWDARAFNSARSWSHQSLLQVIEAAEKDLAHPTPGGGDAAKP